MGSIHSAAPPWQFKHPYLTPHLVHPSIPIGPLTLTAADVRGDVFPPPRDPGLIQPTLDSSLLTTANGYVPCHWSASLPQRWCLCALVTEVRRPCQNRSTWPCVCVCVWGQSRPESVTDKEHCSARQGPLVGQRNTLLILKQLSRQQGGLVWVMT